MFSVFVQDAPLPRAAAADATSTPNVPAGVDAARAAALPGWVTPATNFPGINWKVAPPRLGGERVGVFATRAPHRPNPIGLSLVSVLGIDLAARPPYILLGGSDLVDGTPVLDIKPFVPHYDTVPMGVRVPSWIHHQGALV